MPSRIVSCPYYEHKKGGCAWECLKFEFIAEILYIMCICRWTMKWHWSMPHRVE